MDSTGRQSGTWESGLVILTGASHTGKSSVGRELLRLTDPPAALLAVDDILTQELIRTSGDKWDEIPIAYDLIAAQSAILLERGWLVVVESTFTYVPLHGRPEFHAQALARLTELAERGASPWLVVQLQADAKPLAARATTTGRLAPEIVSATAALHEVATLPDPTLRLDSSRTEPPELAALIAGRLRRT